MSKKLILNTLQISFILLVPFGASAETLQETMYSEGKIYVVVAVLSVIFAGLAIYLSLLDRKISKLENKQKDNRQNNS